MKKILTIAAALFIGASGAALAQKQEPPKPAPAPAAKVDTKAAATPAAAPAAKPDATPAADAKKEPMDINTASEKDLASLPKIGEARAKTIVKGRPYYGKDDLINKKVIPQDAYDAIKDLIVAKQPKKEEAKKEEPKKETKKEEPKKDEKKK